MEPIDYLRSLRRRWRIIAACLLLAVAVAWFTAPSTPAQQVSSASAFTATTILLQEPGAARSVQYLALFVTNGEVPIEAAKRLNYGSDPQRLAADVAVTTDPSVGSLSISSSGTDGPRAALVANTFADSLLSYLTDQRRNLAADETASITKRLKDARQQIQDLQDQLAIRPDDALLQAQKDAVSAQYGALYSQLQQQVFQQNDSIGVTVLQRATPIALSSSGFSAPSSRWGRVRLGAIAGLFLGCLLALVLERFDVRLRTRGAAQEAYALPILTEIPRLPRDVRHGHAIVSLTLPGSAAAEAYRTLRSSLLLLPSRPIPADLDAPAAEPRPGEPGPKVVLVVSARQGEGKTSTVVNVATTLAEAGKRVLVLDHDLRAPEAHLYLDVPNGAGMAELLESAEDQDLLSLSRPTAVPGVRLVTGGRRTERPSALPARTAQLVREARQLADVVLIDTTPMLLANDAIDLMPNVDSVVVVARIGRTTREQADRTVELMTRMRVPVSGVVLIGTGQGGLTFPRAFGVSYSSGGTRRSSQRSAGRHDQSKQLAR